MKTCNRCRIQYNGYDCPLCNADRVTLGLQDDSEMLEDRIDALENKLKEKEKLIGVLENRLDSLKEVGIELPIEVENVYCTDCKHSHPLGVVCLHFDFMYKAPSLPHHPRVEYTQHGLIEDINKDHNCVRFER